MAMVPLDAAAVSINYMSDAVYLSETRNPSGRLPERDLRLLYQNNQIEPIEVAQVLCHKTVTTLTKFAFQCGDNGAAARDFFTNGDGLADIWDRDNIIRTAQIATFLAVRADAIQGRAALAEQCSRRGDKVDGQAVQHDAAAPTAAQRLRRTQRESRAVARAACVNAHHAQLRVLMRQPRCANGRRR